MNTDFNDKKMMKRRTRRAFKTKQWREWRALIEELDRLRSVVWNAPIVPLEQPYQRGWVRYFKLDAELSNRMDYPQIAIVLKALNRVQYCRLGTFLRRKRKGKGMRVREHHLRIPSTRDLETYKLPEELLRYLVLPSGRSLNSYDECRQMRIDGYRLALRFCFAEFCESVTEPYMITHQKVVLPEVASRLQLLENMFERERLWERLFPCRWYERYLERDRTLRLCHEWEIQEELLQFEIKKDPPDSGSFFMRCVIAVNSFKDGDVGHFVNRKLKNMKSPKLITTALFASALLFAVPSADAGDRRYDHRNDNRSYNQRGNDHKSYNHRRSSRRDDHRYHNDRRDDRRYYRVEPRRSQRDHCAPPRREVRRDYRSHSPLEGLLRNLFGG